MGVIVSTPFEGLANIITVPIVALTNISFHIDAGGNIPTHSYSIFTERSGKRRFFRKGRKTQHRVTVQGTILTFRSSTDTAVTYVVAIPIH